VDDRGGIFGPRLEEVVTATLERYTSRSRDDVGFE
jgi:hypothetical protein